MHSDGIERVFKCVRQRLPNLRKHKVVLRQVAHKRVSSPNKRLINQRGGFLPPLLSAVLPTLANLLFVPRAK